MQVKKNIGNRIRQIRKAQNLTQQEFVEFLGITQGFYTGIETGRYTASIEILTCIASKFGINLHWLLTGEGDMEKPDYEIPGKDEIGVVKEEKGVYTTRPTIGKILIMLEEMGDDDLREVLRFLEKEKLLRELMEEKKKGVK